MVRAILRLVKKSKSKPCADFVIIVMDSIIYYIGSGSKNCRLLVVTWNFRLQLETRDHEIIVSKRGSLTQERTNCTYSRTSWLRVNLTSDSSSPWQS